MEAIAPRRMRKEKRRSRQCRRAENIHRPPPRPAADWPVWRRRWTTRSTRRNAACCSGTSCASAATSTASIWPRPLRMCSTTQVELLVDGRTLERPVNYALVRVRSADGRRDRSDAPAVRHRRPARRAWSRHRRLQGRQRDRRRVQGGASLLFHRFPARSDAGPDHRGHRARRSGLSREGDRAAPGGRRQALRGRQLPGRLGGDDARRRCARNCSARSSSPARRCPTGPACAASIRCATAAACWAAAG